MTDELTAHLEALRHWIEKQGYIPKFEPGLSTEERKQLQAVNKTIMQLTRLNVSVPEDLRNLKLRLSTKDVSGAVNREVEEKIAEIEALIDQLRKITQAARSLRNRLKSTGQAGGTKKHYDVTLLDLLQSGHLSTEDRFELQWLKDGQAYEGKVKSDGSIMAQTTSGWKQYDTLSAAAVDIAGRALNGWRRWHRRNNDGSRTSLIEIRSRYIRKGTNQ